MNGTFRKDARGAPPGYPAWEAAGLRWLGAAGGGAVVEVVDVSDGHLDLVRLDAGSPTPDAAEHLGRALAVIHAAGAPAFGSPPDGWSGDGWLGPTSGPLPLVLGAWRSWGEFAAEGRVAPLVRLARDRGVFSADDAAHLDRFAQTLAGGRYDTGDAPARLHGDLWSGNVVWTASGAVLIDPAAHGGHREADLAMLALFGLPHLDRVLATYDEAFPLVGGWRERAALHQVHPLLVHAVLFGGAYGVQAVRAASRYC
ncbi:MAG: fructosamine kinase family protein [Dermatophilaceae bacterium]